jgi:hypothetical protein
LKSTLKKALLGRLMAGNKMIVREMDFIKSLNKRTKDGILLLEELSHHQLGIILTVRSSSWDDWDSKDNKREEST